MPRTRTGRFQRLLFILTCFVTAISIASVASAAGRVKWKSTRLKERESRGGSWQIELEIHLNRAPDVPTLPVKFEFKEDVYYERYKDDAHGDKPVIRKVPTPGKQPIIENSDIGFLDPSIGKIQKRTRFSFKITRAHGFEAGEWTVKIRNTRNGQQIGGATRIILEGDNEVIDRRSMVFASRPDGDKGKGDKKEEEKKETSDEEAAPSNPDDDEANWPETTDEELYGPIHDSSVKEKPGGCGCRTGGAPKGHTALGLALFALALGGGAWRRRRR